MRTPSSDAMDFSRPRRVRKPSVPSSGDPLACYPEPGGRSWDHALPGLSVLLLSQRPPTAQMLLPALCAPLGCICQRDAGAGRRQPAAFPEDLGAQERADCGPRGETTRDALPPTPASSSLLRSTPQARSVFSVFLKNNFTSKLVCKL